MSTIRTTSMSGGSRLVAVRMMSGRANASRATEYARATATGAPILALLRARGLAGLVASATPLWIINGIAARVRPSVVAELAARPEVASVTLDQVVAAPAAPAAEEKKADPAPAPAEEKKAEEKKDEAAPAPAEEKKAEHQTKRGQRQQASPRLVLEGKRAYKETQQKHCLQNDYECSCSSR